MVCNLKKGGCMKPFSLPKSLKLGSATAATQIEGGDKHSNWYHWSLKGRIADGASSIVAADHYNRVEEDIQIMKDLKQEIYRMSIEWSRIEPNEGIWSQEGIDHYINELTALKKAGIEPLVTLHHFSQPQWFEEKGAWLNKASVQYFIRFVDKIVDAIGHLVSDYCTINEPNVFCTDTYMDNKYPPGYKDQTGYYFKASKNLIMSHLEAYQLIHRKRRAIGYKDTQVGIAMHLAHMEVKGSNPLTHMSKKLMHHSFHDIFIKGMIEGKLLAPIGFGCPYGKGIYCDFLGVNYYSRHLIHSSNNPSMLFGEVKVDENIPEESLNDLGWEIYPEGLYQVIEPLYKKYKLPVFITENGIADADDSKRAQFIYDHLRMVKVLIQAGVDVQRYYYWSLLDNLEWNDGYGPRFGLVEVNYDDLSRTIRKSGNFYRDVIGNRGVSKEMIQEYLK